MYKYMVLLFSIFLVSCSSLNPQQREFSKVRSLLASYPHIQVSLIEQSGIFLSIKEKDLCNDNRREISKGIKEVYKLYGYSYAFRYDFSEVSKENSSVYKDLNKKFITGKHGEHSLDRLCFEDINKVSDKTIKIIIPPNNKKFYEM